MAKEIGTSFQTDKFIVKLGKKAKLWYIALQRKSDTQTIVETFKTKKLAEQNYLKMISK